MSSKRHSNCLTIGDLSRLTGVNIETIRYYERMGLMPHPARTQAGRRSFGGEDLRRLAFIKRSRELDFCLDDIRTLLSLRDNDPCCEDVRLIASRHLDGVRSKMRRLIELEKKLSDAVGHCPGGKAGDCTVLEILDDRPDSRKATAA